MEGVRRGGVVCAAVQWLLRLRALLQMSSVQTAGVLQERWREAHLPEVICCGNMIPGISSLVVRRELCQLRLCWRQSRNIKIIIVIVSKSVLEMLHDDNRRTHSDIYVSAQTLTR